MKKIILSFFILIFASDPVFAVDARVWLSTNINCDLKWSALDYNQELADLYAALGEDYNGTWVELEGSVDCTSHKAVNVTGLDDIGDTSSLKLKVKNNDDNESSYPSATFSVTVTAGETTYVTLDPDTYPGNLWITAGYNRCFKDVVCPASYALDGDNESLSSLRNYRDQVLAKSAAGQKIIDLYYATGSAVCKVLENNPVLKERCREILNFIIPVIEKNK